MKLKNGTAALDYSLIQDIGILVKFKLSLMVVLSSVMSYMIIAQHSFQWKIFIILSLGGLFVTFAANALNQGLERDFDKMMVRTSLRPVADNRMTLSVAVLISGLFCTTGVILLSLLSMQAATLGMLSFVLYAFVYTPLKRYSPLAIPVGAIPGALPTLIGGVVASQGFSLAAIGLFCLQYLWQFPHFWSIAWLGHEDYKRAGFKLITDVDGKPDPKYGLYSTIYSILSLVVLLWIQLSLEIHPAIFFLLVFLILVYSFYSWKFYRSNDENSARKLMFASFFYLPVLLTLFLINNQLV